MIFLLNLPFGLLVIAATIARVAESRDPHPRRLDWAGLLTFSLALTLLVFGLLRGNAEGWSSPAIVATLTAAAFLIGAFLVLNRYHGKLTVLYVVLGCGLIGTALQLTLV